MSKYIEVQNYIYEYIKDNFLISEDSYYSPDGKTYVEHPNGCITYYRTIVIISNKETFQIIIDKIRNLQEIIHDLYNEKYSYIYLYSSVNFNDEVKISLEYKNIQEREHVKTIEIQTRFTLKKEYVRSDKIEEILQ